MTLPITKQELIDASLDADTIGGFVNGDSTTDVTSRLGESYPSIAKLIVSVENAADAALDGIANTMLTTAASTGAPLAKTTLALLTAVTTEPSGRLGYVTNDATVNNNGLYMYTSGAWLKSVDLVSVANTYTDSKVNLVINPHIVSRNLVIAATVQAGKTLNSSGAVITSASFSTTDFIPVSASTAYSKTAATGAWCMYDAAKVFISYTTNAATITTTSSTAFVRASIFTGATFDVQKGGVLGDADTYATKAQVVNQYLALSDVKSAITYNGKLDASIQVSARQLDFLTRVSPNLFDSNRYYPLMTLAVATVNSVLYATPKTSASYFMSDVIPVLPSTSYRMSGFGVWVQYDSNMAVVAYNSTAYYAAVTITTHASAAFFQFSFANASGVPSAVMFTLLSEYPAVYIPYRRFILPSEIAADTAWRAKTILWLGTSIPSGGGYPENVTANLLATLNKQSISGGRARARKSDGSWFLQSDFAYQFALSKADINARYGGNLGLNVSATDYLTLSGGGPVLTQGMLDALTASNYEVRLTPNIAGSNLFVLDYGINDRNGQLPDLTAVFKTCEQLQAEGDLYNRNEFLGAMNFLIKQIQDVKSAANDKNYRIVIISHHTRGNFQTAAGNVVTAQENLAKFWGFPLINLADNLGVNDVNIASLTNAGDGLHFSVGSNLEKRYTRYITAKLRDLDT